MLYLLKTLPLRKCRESLIGSGNAHLVNDNFVFEQLPCGKDLRNH